MAISRRKDASTRNQGCETILYSEQELKHIFELMHIIERSATGGDAYAAKIYAGNTMRAYWEYGEKGVSMQIPYVLANLQHWRGELAKQTKAHLKSYIR